MAKAKGRGWLFAPDTGKLLISSMSVDERCDKTMPFWIVGVATTLEHCHRHDELLFNPSPSYDNENDDTGASTNANDIFSSPFIVASSNNQCPSMQLLSSVLPTSQIIPPERSLNNRAGSSCRNNNNNNSSSSKRFITKMALISSACAVILLFTLTLLFSEWKMQGNPFIGDKTDSVVGRHPQQRQLSPTLNVGNGRWKQREQISYISKLQNRYLNQDGNGSNNSNNNNDASNGDYASYRCDEIFIHTPSSSSSSSSPSERCLYARTCDEGSGILLPFVFCHTSHLSTLMWMILLSPPLLLLLTLLFRLLGSTADDYFSPSLEMFSTQLGLPPRFAGVTLLALGNGASDVSATMNAIASDPEHGYKMSLGALTGGAMFVTTVVAGSVILAGGGVVCRGALVRDVAALGVTVIVVAWNLEKGAVGPGVSANQTPSKST
jgi:Ca2+/H+ antiporter